MPQATQAAFDARIELDDESSADVLRSSPAVPGDIRLTVHRDMAAIEQDWRAFEQVADCTVFQSFDWLSTWQHHIGRVENVTPAIVTGRDSQGRLQFLLPLAIESGLARRLVWLGSELCDYNAPMLAPDFGKRYDAARFVALWREIVARLQATPEFRFDAICFDKMQNIVGAQVNPFMALGVSANPNGAYLTKLFGDWETFYTEKRSSSTRRRDRTKRKKLGEFGEVRFVTPDAGDVAGTLETLMDQKSKSFAAMGVANIFARPGHREFYHALSVQRGFVHVSRLDVGSQVAAANLGLIFRGSYYHLLASYDGGELSKFGPGAAHMHDLIRYAIEHGCNVFDFTIGDERYKQEWCEGQITLYDYVSAKTLRGCAVALPLFGLERLKRYIKQTPALWDAAFKLRAFLGPMARRLRG